MCDGEERTIYINADKVNYPRKLSQTKGAQIESREIELRSLGKKK